MSLNPIRVKKRKHREESRYTRFSSWHTGPEPEKWIWTPKKFALIFLALLVIGIFAIGQYPGGPIPTVQGDYNTSFSHTRTPIFTDTQFNGPAQGLGLLAFNAKANASAFKTANTPITLALSVTNLHTIVLAFIVHDSSGTRGTLTVSDSQSNSYTLRVSSLATGPFFAWDNDLYIYTAKATATGSDTISISNTQAGSYEEVAALDYSGVGSFGTTGTNHVVTSGSQSGTNSLTLTTASSSFIVELFDTSANGGSGCGMTVTNGSGQTLRDNKCGSGNFDYRTTDVTGKAGSNTFSFSWTNVGANCDGTNGCLNAQVALELIQGQVSTDFSKVRWNYNSTCVSLNGPSATEAVFDYSLGSASTSNPGLNCSSADIMITKASFNLQSGSGRMLEAIAGWVDNPGGALQFNRVQNLTLVLRTNGTLPGFTENFNPFNDKQSRFIWSLCPVYICSPTGNQTIYIGHDNSKSISQEALPNDFVIQGKAPQFNGTSVAFGIQSILNFTGPLNFIEEYSSAAASSNSTNSASQLQFGQDYYLLIMATFNTALAPCPGCNAKALSFAPGAFGPNIGPLGIWSVPSSCSDPVNKVACALPTPQPVFQFNPLDPSSWGNAIIKGLVWVFTVAIGQALFVIFQVVLPLMITGMNVIGNFLGLGNIGTDIATFLGFWIQFFTNQLPTAFNNLGTLFARWFDSLAILFAWVPIMLSIALNLLGLGVSAISFLLLVVQDIFILWDTMIVLLLILFWFADIGEYGLAGFQAWFETMKYLVFGLGMKPLLETIHYGTDVILLFVGLVPKPIIQIAAKFDTIIPSIDISGSPTWPSFRMDEVREGNYFAILGFLIGLVVLIWFETTNLPGSITALVPGVGTTLTRDAPLVNLFLMFLEIFGFVALFILPGQMFKGIAPVGLPGVSQLQFRRGPSVQVSKVSTGFRRREPGRILLRAQKKLAESKTKVAQKPSAQGVG